MKNILSSEEYNQFLYHDSLHIKLELSILKYHDLVNSFGVGDSEQELILEILQILEVMGELRLVDKQGNPLYLNFVNEHLAKLDLDADNKEKIVRAVKSIEDKKATNANFISQLI